MILYISMIDFGSFQKLNLIGQKLLLEECAGEKCLLVHYSQITREEIEELSPSAIVYSGGDVPYEEHLQSDNVKSIMQGWPKAQLAICYSAQLAMLYEGARLEPIGPLDPDEPDTMPYFQPGMKKEYGVYPVEVTGESVLFEGLGPRFMVGQEHALTIQNMPAGYTVTARSPLCEVQAYQAEDRPFFGVQFHPEKHRIVDRYPAGAQLLRNFFAHARRLGG